MCKRFVFLKKNIYLYNVKVTFSKKLTIYK